MLESDAASLADKVTDGPWIEGLYPEDDAQQISSSLVWRVLGSPYAVDRWRAAHSIRSFARFGQWGIIDSVVARLGDESIGPFHAVELTFYLLHAKLWLLIALARIALDHPKQVARYKNDLLPIATQIHDPHVLMRHFAARCLLACVDAGNLRLRANVVKQLREIDVSPYPQSETRSTNRAGYYSGRPDSEPKPKHEFVLDYDFHKHDVDNFARIFGKPCWQAADTIAEFAHSIDPGVSNMHDDGGRASPYRRSSLEMGTRHHTYGEHVGWHALFYTAGRFFQKFPVTTDSWYDEPWAGWLGGYLLTHKDGFWLSDGTDRTPLDVALFLLKRVKNDFAITGDRDKLLQLAGIGSRIRKEIVIEGNWHSADSLKVDISSALVPPSKAATLARKLTREDPMLVWVPTYHENEEELEYLRGDKKQYTPWIVSPSGEVKLDEHDPYGVPCANWRPRLANEFVRLCGLTCEDPFGRYWINKQGKPMLRAEAWGREDKYRDGGPYPGTRLICTTPVLKKILTKKDKDLLLLIRVRRYEKETYRRGSQYTHTVAVARITKALDLEYFKGRINHLHKSRW